MFEDMLDDEHGESEDLFPFAEEKEELPPASVLRPPREMAALYGHERTEQQLAALINKGTLPHALVLTGQRGIGKATLAFRLARALLKSGGANAGQDSLFGESIPPSLNSFDMPVDDPVFRKVAAGGHPDLLTVERPVDDKKGAQKESLDIDSVRRIAPFLRMTSSAGGWRIVLIDDADTMTRAAQNAVLKILEEPPRQTLLLLICHRSGALIPTIRSRCRFVAMEPLSQETLYPLLQKHFPGELDRDLAFVALMAEGSLGQAIQIVEDGGLESLGTVLDVLRSFPQWPWPSLHHFSEGFSLARAGGGGEQGYRNFTRLMEWILQQMLYVKIGHRPLPPFLQGHGGLQAMLSHYSLEEWVKICENLKAHFETYAKANLDKRQAVLGAFALLQ